MRNNTEPGNDVMSFMEALDTLENTKGINKTELISKIELAIASAYLHSGQNGTAACVHVTIDQITGKPSIFANKKVVDEINPQNAGAEVLLAEAQKLYPKFPLQVGDFVDMEIFPRDFGRIAVSKAKNAITQFIRETERDAIKTECTEKTNEAVTAIVLNADKDGVYLELGRTNAFMPAKDMIPNEEYFPGKRIKVYLTRVVTTGKNMQVYVSRTDSHLISRLFEMEVPEIMSGLVQIKAVARDPGLRSKIAVMSTSPQIDPVGACVGPRGTRVEQTVRELNNEKIDIIVWDPDPVVFIAKSLSPANVMRVYINPEQRAARVIVSDDQLSLAIGKGGQNACLAAKLTGWKIDIIKVSDAGFELDDVNSVSKERINAAMFEDLRRNFEDK